MSFREIISVLSHKKKIFKKIQITRLCDYFSRFKSMFSKGKYSLTVSDSSLQISDFWEAEFLCNLHYPMVKRSCCKDYSNSAASLHWIFYFSIFLYFLNFLSRNKWLYKDQYTIFWLDDPSFLLSILNVHYRKLKIHMDF